MQFTKYQGAGNDYLFVDGRDGDHDWAELSRRASDRHFGVGADGLIVAARSGRAPVRMRIFNADGSEGEMCGNGIRCFAKFTIERGIVPGGDGPLDIETNAGVLSVVPSWQGGRVVGALVDMGEPILTASEIPVDPSQAGANDYASLDGALLEELGLSPSDLLFDAPLRVNGATFTGTAVSMGNPHFVAFIDTPVYDVPLEREGLGALVERHPAFPNRVNFHIVNVLDRTHLATRTWERGSGITLACGTGACAVVVAARLHGLVGDEVNVAVPGGELTITWPGSGPVLMAGDAVEVFSGEFPD